MPISTSGPATGLDIVAYRGDDFERWIQFLRNGVEENFSLSSFRMQIRNGSVLIRDISTTVTSSGDISLEQVNGGVLYLRIPANVMAQLPAGAYAYDIEQTYPTSKIKTRIRGSFTITDDVTKPVI